MKVKFAICLLIALIGLPVNAQLRVSGQPVGNSVNLGKCSILVDSLDHHLIATAAGLFADDFHRVTGKSIPVAGSLSKNPVIIIGTPQSRYIQDLAARKLIDISEISNSPERYIITTVKSPFKGCDEAVVVAGSDYRGAAYGILSISERMGVSPWYWWADVPVKSLDNVYVSGKETSKSPTIRYRGIFLNDEDWGLTPWAGKTVEPEVGNIGPRTYAKICELILRLKGNMLAPAMHACSTPFYCNPENKVAADSFGIMITTSHCEPLLFNNASKLEWDSAVDGEWNYKTNRNTIYGKLDRRVKEAAKFDNIYTLAMRGLHDEGMRGDMTTAEKVEMLEQAITDQREILSRYIDGDIDSIPQIFVPYKEAQELYESGLKVPDNVTLVWPDDNYGYIKMLSNPADRLRKGRAGVYYHVSYLGAPHDYLWLNTTAPMLMYEELKKAYDTGADRYWLLNVGDIKPMELAVQTFFDMAWDFDRFNYENINRRQSAFLGSVFGDEYTPDFQEILDQYYRLAWSRKPEFMGWEREWDSPEYTGLKDPEYSFDNYNEAASRLKEYSDIADRCRELYDKLPDDYKASFFELLGYPVMAANQMNRKFLMAGLNHKMTEAKEYGKANWAALQSQQAYDSINALSHRYNTQLDGKWDGMMAIPPGYVALYHKMPEVKYHDGYSPEAVDLSIDKSKEIPAGYAVIPVDSYKSSNCGTGHTIRILEGIGYDWKSLQLGEPLQPLSSIDDDSCLRVDYQLPVIDSDSITVILYTMPRFPLYKGAESKFAMVVDGNEPVIFDDILKEWSLEWKDQVLQNGKANKASFKIASPRKPATLSILAQDPGLIIQRIIIDYGGLKESYIGPRPLD